MEPLGNHDDEESLVCTSAVPNEFVGPSPPPYSRPFPTVLYTLVIALQEACFQSNRFRSLDNDLGNQCDDATSSVNTITSIIMIMLMMITNHGS